MLYIPEEYKASIFHEFKEFFPAPQNHKQLTQKHDRREGDVIFPGQKETKGFQTKIRSAGGYILKYILKSFRNLLEEKELDYLQAWYVQNKIPRIITTHTLVSQEVYHHASLLDDDWFYLTNIKLNDYFERDKMMNTFSFKSHSDREIIFNNGFYQLKNKGKVIKEFGENKIFSYTFTVECPIRYPHVADIPTALTDKFWLCKRMKRHIYVIEEQDDFIEVEFIDNNHKKVMLLNPITSKLSCRHELVAVNNLTYLELYDLYTNFDFDKYHPAKYALIKNRLIDIGFINEFKVGLNDFNTNFDENSINKVHYPFIKNHSEPISHFNVPYQDVETSCIINRLNPTIKEERED